MNTEYKVQLFKLPKEFETKLERYMNEELDFDGRTQHCLDYEEAGEEIRKVNQDLVSLKYWNGDREEFCNDLFSPIAMQRIIDFVMKQK